MLSSHKDYIPIPTLKIILKTTTPCDGIYPIIINPIGISLVPAMIWIKSVFFFFSHHPSNFSFESLCTDVKETASLVG